MAKRTDWSDFRHRLSDETERLMGLLPDGMRLWCSVHAYGVCVPQYSVGISWDAEKLIESGEGSTPTLAYEAARKALQKAYEAKPKPPRLAAEAKPLALPAKKRQLTR
jgi:hypothetical protein